MLKPYTVEELRGICARLHEAAKILGKCADDLAAGGNGAVQIDKSRRLDRSLDVVADFADLGYVAVRRLKRTNGE